MCALSSHSVDAVRERAHTTTSALLALAAIVAQRRWAYFVAVVNFCCTFLSTAQTHKRARLYVYVSECADNNNNAHDRFVGGA